MTGKTYSTEEMLARLIAFDTTSRDGNIPLIEFVEDYLDGWGVPHLRVDYEANRKTNLFATIGPDIAGGIVPRFTAFLRQSRFRARFEDKGPMRDYVRAIPVYVITRPNPGMLGAARADLRD